MLGYDPYYLACEGRIVFVAATDIEGKVFAEMGVDIVEIGIIEANHRQVLLETSIGGLRMLPELEADPLPRIC